ncbi:hydroxymethylcytosylglucuronate/cytosylglucuronate synthase [Streptomyces sp. BE303]|uniref:hydroxymethylcytosylglucuronate/cytosylglucurona te synthase n=1 Tax=Streptomyces sp. BE303 TaxID=3002528 RepID=UPI002E75BFB6|nr:hydroxymethylcytosylglucuronate/cytosylglucuronate synthase [Streptomyces sp. BE303]MED7953065.1 hydroxymethylcytosylglucuronate/cytosylglucuronate synthase [Streptomyces sp. BE303]
MPSDVAAPAENPAPGSGPATVALVGAEFGWGSSGKLSAVLSALRRRPTTPLRFVGLASGLGRPLLAEHTVDGWYDLPADPERLAAAVREIVRSQGVRAAVVVLDGAAAKALLAAGVPTVFVDSLPFLWSEGDRDALPLDTTVYCAQRSVELPSECLDVLAGARALRWVEAVIAAPSALGSAHAAGGPAGGRSTGGPYRRALISLGGLRAPRLGDPGNYPRLVVPAVLEALAAHGVEEVHIAGNLPADLAGRLVDASIAPPRTTTGPLGHGAFLERLAASDVLLTSPGLTTLLEAGGLNVPTICLPPQNLSQIFNGRYHSQALDARLRVPWPKDVLAEDEALALRSEGEDHALELIYGAIEAAARGDDHRAVGRVLRDGVLEALRRSAEVEDWGALTTAVGTGGAAQVADALLEVLDAAHPST